MQAVNFANSTLAQCCSIHVSIAQIFCIKINVLSRATVECKYKLNIW